MELARGGLQKEKLEELRNVWVAVQRRNVAFWLEYIQEEHNLDSKWGLIEGELSRYDPSETLELVLALEHFMLERGHWRTMEFFVANALKSCRVSENWLHLARMSAALGRLCFRQGDTSKGKAALEEGEAVCSQISDYLLRDKLLGTILYLQGAVVRLMGDQDSSRAMRHYDRSIELCRRAVVIKRRIEDHHGMASALFNLGAAQTERAGLLDEGLRRNDLLGEALRSLRQSHELFDQVGDTEHGVRTSIRIARILIGLGDVTGATAIIKEVTVDKERSPRTWVDRELIRARVSERLMQFSEAEEVSRAALVLANRHAMNTEIRQLNDLLERVRLKSGMVEEC